MSTETWRDRAARALGVAAADLPSDGTIGSFDGATTWLNSEPLTRRGLGGDDVVPPAPSISTRCGRELPRDTQVNRGTAFIKEERAGYGLKGVPAAGVPTLEELARRSAEQDRDEVLYDRLLEEHLKEVIPVGHDSVVAQSIRQYNHEHRRHNLLIHDPDGVGDTLRKRFEITGRDSWLVVLKSAMTLGRR